MEPNNTPLLSKLTWLWAIGFSIDALCNGIVISMANIEWGTLTPTKKVVIAAMVIKTWMGAMIALFTQSATRIEKGKTIIPLDDTAHWTKADLPVTPPTPTETKQP